MNTGDLLGSGTISGPDQGTEGSLLEQSKNGKESVVLEGGESRVFLQDGDSINLRGWAGNSELGLVGFGDCLGSIVPALSLEDLFA